MRILIAISHSLDFFEANQNPQRIRANIYVVHNINRFHRKNGLKCSQITIVQRRKKNRMWSGRMPLGALHRMFTIFWKIGSLISKIPMNTFLFRFAVYSLMTDIITMTSTNDEKNIRACRSLFWALCLKKFVFVLYKFANRLYFDNVWCTLF